MSDTPGSHRQKSLEKVNRLQTIVPKKDSSSNIIEAASAPQTPNATPIIPEEKKIETPQKKKQPSKIANLLDSINFSQTKIY